MVGASFFLEKKNKLLLLPFSYNTVLLGLYSNTIMCHFFTLNGLSPMIRFGITSIYLYNFDPLKPHFYIVKLGFTGVYIFVLISAQKHKLWVIFRTSSASGSNMYQQSVF